MREVAREPVEHDRGSAVDDGERVPPEPQRDPECDRGYGERVQPLARGVVVLPRHPDHDRVERLLESSRAPRDPAEQRFRVSNRRRAGEGRDDGQLTRQILEDLAAQAGRQERVATERGRDEVAERPFLVGIAAKAPEQSRRIEDERRADHRHARGEHALERQSQLPAARRSGLDQRVRRCGPKGLWTAGAEQRTGTSVKHCLGRRHGDDEIGLDEPSVDPQRRAAHVAEVDQIRRLGVVSLDQAVEPAGSQRWKEGLLLAVSGPAVETPGDEDRLLRRWNAQSLELGECGGERLAAGVVRGARQRQLRCLHDDRRPPAALDEGLERCTGERKAKRVAHRRTDVRNSFGGRWGPEHERVVGGVDDGDARARRHRDPRHDADLT